jgi:hypothetical protein
MLVVLVTGPVVFVVLVDDELVVGPVVVGPVVLLAPPAPLPVVVVLPGPVLLVDVVEEPLVVVLPVPLVALEPVPEPVVPVAPPVVAVVCPAGGRVPESPLSEQARPIVVSAPRIANSDAIAWRLEFE